MNIIVLWSTLAWVCPWWAPKAKQLQPLLCEPKVNEHYFLAEDQTEALLAIEKLGPGIQSRIVMTWFDERGQAKEEFGISWKPQLKKK